MTLTVIKDDVAKLLHGIDTLTSQRVLVGVPASTTDRQSAEPINNASIAYIQDNGAPDAGIPPRPFMEPGIMDAREKIEGRLKQAAEASLKGDSGKVDRAMHAAGLIASSSIKSKITEGPFLPLSPRTLAARRAKGRTGTKPLIDTAQLRAAISYVLRKITRR